MSVVGVLRQPHRPQRAGVRPTRIDLGGAANLLGGNAGDLRGFARRVRLYGRADLLEIVRARRDEVPVFEAQRENVMQHPRVEGDVGPRLHLQVDVGAAGELGPARIGDDQRGTLLVRAFQRGAEHGMRLRRVRTGDEDDVAGRFDLAHRAGGSRRIDRALHGRNGRRVAQACAVIDVVRSQRAAKHPHDQVILFVGALRRRKTGEGIRTTRALDPQQLLRGELERFVPRGFAEWRVPFVRRRHAVPNVHIDPFQQRQLAHGFASGAGRGTGFGALAFSLDRAPGSAASVGSLRSFP